MKQHLRWSLTSMLLGMSLGVAAQSAPTEVRDPDAQQLAGAWQRFASQMAGSADAVTAAPFADNGRDLADGYRHLARATAYALQNALVFSDPEFPSFHRGLDHLSPWGAPNIDNLYLMATIDGRGSYRVWGNVGSIDGFILNLSEGTFPIFPGFKTSAEASSRDLKIGADGSFEILLSAQRPRDWTGNWLKLSPSDTKVSIRQYLTDWQRHQPAALHIVKLGNEGKAPAPLTPKQLDEALAKAAQWSETVVRYYQQRLKNELSQRHFNVLPPPERKVPGSRYTHYGIAFYDIAEDEALVIEMPAQPAPYWGVQLYNFWNEFTDPFNRLTSINNRQAFIDEDGVFRAVLSHRDPGIHNWLDAAQYRQGYLWYRWVWADEVPTPRARVVKLAELDRVLPASTPRLTPAQRTEQRMQRRMQLETRYYQ